jgi:multidrug efflux pump subunit AcrB
VVDALAVALGQRNVDYLRDAGAKYAVPIRVILDEGDRAQPSALMSLPVTYVTADMAGEVDSPLYGMFALASELYDQAGAPTQYWINQPDWAGTPALKWDGEWQITFEVFRDLGIAFAGALVLIYVLIVAWFGSFSTPLVMMAAIPLTLVGIGPGHVIFGAFFTATSMIGMIALAGIIVRNSILLVVFVRQLLEEGESLEDAVVLAGVVRLKPIALTAISAMLGAAFILPDPIFNGLSISLIFGLLVSTVMTVLLVPLLYYVFIGDSEVRTQ